MARAPTPRTFTSLADALRLPLDEGPERLTLTKLRLRGALALAGVAAVALVWSSVAPLSGAVIAPGVVKTELNRKTVQHLEGGIVREILVREGQRVKAGDPLLVVGDVRTDATLDLQQDQRVAESIREARLLAELKLAPDFALPAGTADSPGHAQYLARERALFAARRSQLMEQVQSLESQALETEAQVRELSAQVEAIDLGRASAREELEINRSLVEQGFIQRTRVLALERAVNDYDSRSAEQKSERALARQRLADLRSRIAQARNQYQQQAATELKEAVARLRELDERLRPAQDQVERQYVRSPVDGTVMSLRVAAVGVAVGPREPILDVVPAQERLVVEAHVRPEDIDYVQSGAAAEVRLTAYDYRTMPMLPARVLSVSADRVEDARNGGAWFNVQIEVDLAELARFPGTRMQAGMPAEAYLTTPPRSLFDYLFRPLLIFGQRGMREP
ncbi:MAG: HlyD family type I secretion periplasmic adaptor subunit [Burkholderiaceae bacterium]|nr:HlyD family type I secretion periplasmic adaptor subunit [Burkholderiaceae bacterium]